MTEEQERVLHSISRVIDENRDALVEIHQRRRLILSNLRKRKFRLKERFKAVRYYEELGKRAKNRKRVITKLVRFCDWFRRTREKRVIKVA